MKFRVFVFTFFMRTLIMSETIQFSVDIDTDPEALVQTGCSGKRKSCYNVAIPLVSREKNELLGLPLNNWRYDEVCRCQMPPQEKLGQMQFLHIPKTGTSLNWFLHDYFDCLQDNATSPCMKWLETAEEQRDGLCNGRLFSCMGHSVSPILPELVISSEAYLITMMRDPWKRLQSDFHYIRSRPETGHLGRNINISSILSSVTTIIDYALYPGIGNCATKMLNGYSCGDDINLTDYHLETAKMVLDNTLFVGITDFFQTSLCQLSWMYGGVVKQLHFKPSRVGTYSPQSFHSLSKLQKEQFRSSERFDLELYRYALRRFSSQQRLIRCPILD